ncbi:MAG: hypothetical protein M1833_002045 [Piccolia ochrophora]|nr:MAG: hypothetical protein M1833_002045 [Piccolia ochrophora]
MAMYAWATRISVKSPPREQLSQKGEEDEEDDGFGDDASSTTESASYSPKQRRKHPSHFTSGVPPLAKHQSTDSTASLPSQMSTEGEGGSISTSNAKRSSTAEEGPSPTMSNRAPSGPSNNHRVPYFRYFGPTAIVPGFKQMVVNVKEQRRSTGGRSSSASALCAAECREEMLTTPFPVDSPSSTHGGQSNTGGPVLGATATPSQSGGEPRTTMELPFYDTVDPLPNSPLITHLVETFFIHLGCSFLFLQRERFLRDVEDKKVDAILVNAVCALAARFSTHPLLSTPNDARTSDASEHGSAVPKSQYGEPFAQRAKSAVVDTFSCPTMSVVQACLLLAYDEFGSDHDSGLWMYLGVAIRMAQDLGMQKLEGIHFEGRNGPTPKSVKHGKAAPKVEREKSFESTTDRRKTSVEDDPAKIEQQKAAERERIDTFWAVFFLDRVIASGTGRPVTLRDKDVELSFPCQDDTNNESDWPAPFPPLIRIIHLYGRVSDSLNNIKEVNHVTPDTLKRLTRVEKDLTVIYQRLSPRLHFNAVNFQHYVKVHQGTTFILLHFWFHTLIVLLHQPTLLNSFEGQIQQLFPNSRELSISSAKTIADILAFAELLDAKSFIGNPFTSQPMYIAACAFLLESAAHTASNPGSRDSTPPPPRSTPRESPKTFSNSPTSGSRRPSLRDNALLNASKAVAASESRSSKHTLLATAANQNYQRCYKALKALEQYWMGTGYIVTVLDQKMKGIVDPLLYTTEDVENACEAPNPEPSFTSPGWRRKPSLAGNTGSGRQIPFGKGRLMDESMLVENPNSPMVDPSQAIGWSLAGTTDSPNSNLTFLYQSTNGDGQQPPKPQSRADSAHQDMPLENLPMETASATAQAAQDMKTPRARTTSMAAPMTPSMHKRECSQQTAPGMAPGFPRHHNMAPTHSPHQSFGHSGLSHHSPHSSVSAFSPITSNPATTSDAEMLLGLNSPYATTSIPSTSTPSFETHASLEEPPPVSNNVTATDYDYSVPMPDPGMGYAGVAPQGGIPTFGPGGDMMFETQDVDMNTFTGDMMPWLEYLPQDMLDFFDASADSQMTGDMQQVPGTMPPGPPGQP